MRRFRRLAATRPLPYPASALHWDKLRHFHKQAGVIAAWQRFFGPILRWLTPRRRRLLLALGALIVAVRYPTRNTTRLSVAPDLVGLTLLVLALFGFVLLCYLAAKRFASLPTVLRRHPQIGLHAVLWSLLALLWFTQPANGPMRTVLVGSVIVLPFLLWRVGYMMFTAQRGKMAATHLRDHLFYIYPVWGGSDTPYGKGHDYLSANEACDDTSLAKSQLAGLKCFFLAGLWTIVKGLLAGLVFAEPNIFRQTFGGLSSGVPRLGAMFAAPSAYPIWLCWLALYLELLWAVLALAASGHIIIAWLRMFGFHVFRNTYKPLLAETIVEFWNRYYYYFKELLVNFFFYPAFTRHFKTSPRLRIFAAVFMAAFVGNIYYHWLRLDGALVTGDFSAMGAALQSRVFYCLLLALGIYVSMQRAQRRVRTTRAIPQRALAIFGVCSFFSIIHIWAEKDPAPFLARAHFFLGLFGLR